jgi:GNAT superfamily N-acetyltransferase
MVFISNIKMTIDDILDNINIILAASNSTNDITYIIVKNSNINDKFININEIAYNINSLINMRETIRPDLGKEEAKSAIIRDFSDNSLIKYIAVYNKNIVGYCVGSWLESYDYLKSDKIFYIGDVASSMQGKGIGGTLLNKLFESGIDSNCYALWVDKNNINAINLYKKNGFIPYTGRSSLNKEFSGSYFMIKPNKLNGKQLENMLHSAEARNIKNN